MTPPNLQDAGKVNTTPPAARPTSTPAASSTNAHSAPSDSFPERDRQVAGVGAFINPNHLRIILQKASSRRRLAPCLPPTAPKFLTAIAVVMMAVTAHADINVDRMVASIYRAEGGAATKWPYGIKSVKVSSIGEARSVCLRSVINNRARWEAAGKPKPFIEFMADRYCPAEPDHCRWIKNVGQIYGSAQ